MSVDASCSVERVRAALDRMGCAAVTLPESTHSAAEAAKAIGCQVEQIAKSIVFRAKNSDRPILVIASGANRVNEKRVAELIGEPVEKADADFVRRRTGFAIGGVAPVGHLSEMVTLLDEDLWKYSDLWAAAGTPHSVFKTTAEQLLLLTTGRRTNITTVGARL